MTTNRRSLLLGLVVGMAVSSWTIRSGIVHAKPPSSLTSVAHDSTLTGSGTTSSPLGIANGGVGTTQLANGAVTAAKLGAGTPAAGQFLGFNGSGLQWLSPPGGGTSGPLKIVDNNDQLVGFSMGDPSTVLRLVGSNWLQFNIYPSGLPQGGQFLYESTDCSGTAYTWALGTNNFQRIAAAYVGSVVYFQQATTGLFRNLQSVSQFNGIQWECRSSSQDGQTDVPVAVDFSAFGFVPPFHLTQ